MLYDLVFEWTGFYYSFLTVVLVFCLIQIGYGAILNVTKIISYQGKTLTLQNLTMNDLTIASADGDIATVSTNALNNQVTITGESLGNVDVTIKKGLIISLLIIMIYFHDRSYIV